MADKKPIVLVAGQFAEIGATDQIPVGNMPAGGIVPATIVYVFPAGFTIALEDETNPGQYIRLKNTGGFLDSEPYTLP